MWKSTSLAILVFSVIVGSAHAEKIGFGKPCFMLVAFLEHGGEYLKPEKMRPYLEASNKIDRRWCEQARKRFQDAGVPDPGFACQE